MQRRNPALIKNFLDGEKRRPRVQRVENRFHQQHVRAAVEQTVDLLAISLHQLVVIRAARAGIVHVRRNGRRFGRRADGAGDETDAPGLRLLNPVRRAPRAFRARLRQFVSQRFHPVIRQRDGLRVERVGFDDVRARFEILAMDVLDDRRLGDVQQVVEALEVLAAPVREPRAAKRRLIQLALLDHRAHRAVNDDDAFAQQAFKMFNPVRHRLAIN